LVFTVRFGWIRDWFPGIPQMVITFVNPGTLLIAFCMMWSLWMTHKHNSIRIGAIAMFTCVVVVFIILTYFATVHRGPNWNFYWRMSEWPTH
jgi:hypothetical protein